MATKPTPLDEEKYAEVFTKFTFNDNAGNIVTIKPWSLDQCEVGYPAVGEIYANIKQKLKEDANEYESYGFSGDLNLFIQDHMDVIYRQFPKELINLLMMTTGKPAEWKKDMDAAKAIVALDVIWRQNFTGPRMTDALAKFGQDEDVIAAPLPASEPTPAPSLPGNA